MTIEAGQVTGVSLQSSDAITALTIHQSPQNAGIRDAAIIVCISDAMLKTAECAALDVADFIEEPDGI